MAVTIRTARLKTATRRKMSGSLRNGSVFAASLSKHEIERQRQKDIEMLFDGQRPEVAPSSRKITLDKEDVVKCWFYDLGPAVETMD